jgi:hypothetical protein
LNYQADSNITFSPWQTTVAEVVEGVVAVAAAAVGIRVKIAFRAEAGAVVAVVVLREEVEAGPVAVVVALKEEVAEEAVEEVTSTPAVVVVAVMMVAIVGTVATSGELQEAALEVVLATTVMFIVRPTVDQFLHLIPRSPNVKMPLSRRRAERL